MFTFGECYIYSGGSSVWAKRPEVKDAKSKEIRNLEDYETFELVKDVGQKTIGSCWVITKKEKHDGQKTELKAQLVARGFQEVYKPQSDLPTVAKKSLTLLITLAANEDFVMASMDIRAAFLQEKTLHREVFIVTFIIWYIIMDVPEICAIRDRVHCNRRCKKVVCAFHFTNC